MFQEFPYTDMHQLNLDWIIKIAKDFLDQYTHIQQLIADGEQSLQNLTADGLNQLQEKADNLEALLQAWYDTHSQDIADQLASALADLNAWYTLHQNYLDQTLVDKLTAFNTAADAKAAQTIASIPPDYTSLANKVTMLENIETLTIVTAADYSTILPDLNNVVSSKRYGLNIAAGDTNIPANTPFGSAWQGHYAVFEHCARIEGQRSNLDYQLFNSWNGSTGKYDLYMRYYAGGWSTWVPVINNLFDELNPTPITAANYASVMPNLNNVHDNKTYLFNFANGDTSFPTNTPFASTWEGSISILHSIARTPGSVSACDCQIMYTNIVSGKPNIWLRTYAGGWGLWYPIVSEYLDEFIPTPIVANNYATVMPDLDDVHTNKTYLLNFANGDTNFPAHTPFTDVWRGSISMLISKARNPNTSSPVDTQILYTDIVSTTGRPNIFVRTYAGGWGLWYPLVPQVIVVDKTGAGDFTTLRAGVAEAIKNKNTKVIVNDGTYDLCDEFYTELHGVITGQFGIKLENDVHIVFSSKARVVAHYDGSDASITTNFAPFYAGTKGGFILENLVIDATNTRYCVHDQFDYGTPRNVKYINCRMYMDNTDAVLNYYPTCIGGGNGRCDDITIDNCYFYSKIAETEDPYTPVPLVSYHNSGAFSDSLSHVRVSNSYFDGYGTVRVTYYGSSPYKSIAFVNNNSLGIAPIVKQEIAGGSSPVNWTLQAFMNEIRHS